MYHIQTKQLLKGARNEGVWVDVQPGFGSEEAARDWAMHMADISHNLDIRIACPNGSHIDVRICGPLSDYRVSGRNGELMGYVEAHSHNEAKHRAILKYGATIGNMVQITLV